MTTALKIVFLTRRGLRNLALNGLACYGVVSGTMQFAALFTTKDSFSYPLWSVIPVIMASLTYGLYHTWPRKSISRTIKASAHDVTINVVVGDILEYQGQIVVGFSDTFDTDTQGDRIINSTSLQGRFMARRYNNDCVALDSAISAALQGVVPTSTETSNAKRAGKLARYSIGTTAVLGSSPADYVYALAYSRMGNNLLAESSVHDIWWALGQLWDSVYRNGQRSPIAIPLIGTGLARVNSLDRESMLRMALISFAARSREKLICSELTVYIHPHDQKYINMLELEAFLKTL